MSPARQVTHALTVGDKVPQAAFIQLVNGKQQASSFTRYKSKLLVLDFISTTCAGCVKSMPGIDSMQKEYDNSMQVILVTTQSKEAIQKFLQNNPAGKSLNLPFVTNDSVLRSFFPYEYISHLVWIGPDGIVKAITEGEYLTAANIRQALQNHPLNWPVKNDIAEVNLAPPFLQLNTQCIPPSGNPAGIYYSAFYKHMPGMPQGMHRFTDSSNGTVKTLLVNQSIPDIYRRLYNQSRLPLSNILLQVQQNVFFVYSNEYYRAGWERYNTFSYEAVQPNYLQPKQRLGQILEDVNRYTQTQAYFTDTLVDGFILKDTNTGTTPLLYKRMIGDSVLSISGLLYTLNNNYGAPPVTDGRNIRQQAWLDLPARPAWNDMAELNRQLLTHGLVLQPQPQKIHALVITQTGTYPFTHSPKLYAK
jgi:thiol-disulfide isomerase/thioredoxin